MSDPAKILFDRKDYMGALTMMAEYHASVADRTARAGLKLNMAKCFYQMRRPDLAEGLLRHPDVDLREPLTQVDLSLYVNSQGRHDEAYSILSKLPLDIPAARFNLGWHLVRRGQFLDGFDLMNSGREIGVFGSAHLHRDLDLTKVRRPRRNDRVAVLMEGGHGDCLMFSRWLPLISRECATAVVFCPRSMVDLMRGLGHDAHPDSLVTTDGFDCLIPSMGIPTIFRLEGPTVGMERLDYLSIDVEDPLFNPPSDMMNIGVKVQGNPEFEHEQFRQVPVEVFELLSSLGRLHDFQIESHLVRGSEWVGRRINSWLDTYCMVRKMDLIVSSCTSVAHLAAGMGAKVVVLTPMVPYFVWCGLPWYGDNVVELRQGSDGSWGDVIGQIRDKVGASKTCQVP